MKRILINKHLRSYITIIKDTHRENTPSNKTEVLTKSMNMCVWGVGTVTRLFVTDSYTQIKFSKKQSRQWEKSILCERSILYSPFNLP